MALDEHLTEAQLEQLNAQFFRFDLGREYACLEHEGVFHAYKLQEDAQYHLHATQKAPHQAHPKKERKYLQI